MKLHKNARTPLGKELMNLRVGDHYEYKGKSYIVKSEDFVRTRKGGWITVKLGVSK